MADFVEPLAAICALCAVFFDSASRCCAVSVACNTSGWFSVSTGWIASASGEAAADSIAASTSRSAISQKWAPLEGMRPMVEQQYEDRVPAQNGMVPTNDAGIDLTPATADAIGISGKGIVSWRFAYILEGAPGETY